MSTNSNEDLTDLAANKDVRGKKADKVINNHGQGLSIKTTVKVVKAICSLKNKALKQPNFQLSRMSTVRAPLVTEERLEENVNFNDPQDQKLITDILAIRPQKRFEEEIALLKKAFRDISFFKKIEGEMDETSFTKIFQALRLEFFKAGQKVFSHGDIGKNFYIIIKGSVYILLQSAGAVHTEETQQVFFNTQTDEIIKCKENLGTFLLSDASQEEKKEMIEKCYPGFWVVQQKVKGDSFGELALGKAGNRLRTATVVCSDDTIFGILAFNDYQSILGALIEKKFTENVDCLSKVDIFKHWKENQISSVLLSVEEFKYTRNQSIFKEGDMPKYLYFIKQGEVELRKVIDIDNVKDKEETIDELPSAFLNKPASRQWKRLEAMRLGILTRGDYFGETELLNLKQRDYTAIAYSSEVVLIAITRDKFMGFVKDKKSLQNFEAHIRGKKQWRENLIRKLVYIRIGSSEGSLNNTGNNVSPKANKLRKITNYFVDEQIENPRMKSYSISQKTFEGKIICTEEKLEIPPPPPMSTKSAKSIVTPGSISLNPQAKGLGDLSPRKSKAPRLLSSGFSFSRLKSMSDSNPIYEKQKEKLEKRLQQDRQDLNIFGSGTLQLDSPISSKSRTKPSSSPRQMSKCQSPVTKISTVQFTDFAECYSPISLRESPKRSLNSNADSQMFKMCKTLGLDRIYSEKDLNLISLDGKPRLSMNAISIFPVSPSEPNKLSPTQKGLIRKASCHNLQGRSLGVQTAR